MTDGGVYENLGLSPLLPGRSLLHTAHVYHLDYLIAADAGRGRSERRPARFWPVRMKQVFDVTYGKAQDASRSRIHLAPQDSQVKGFVHAYLGLNDAKLPVPVSDLVPRRAVAGYPTDFARMTDPSLAAISIRAEQLTRVLLSHYCPDLA